MLISSALDGFNQCFFENLTPAIRALRRFFQNVIRQAGIWAGNAVENVIEWNLTAFLVAVLTGFDQP